MSPASNSRISPGTTSFAGISCFLPSLITLASGADSCFKLSKDFSAFICCTVPRTAFITRTAKITMVLSSFPENMDMIAAPIRITTIRSLNWSKKT